MWQVRFHAPAWETSQVLSSWASLPARDLEKGLVRLVRDHTTDYTIWDEVCASKEVLGHTDYPAREVFLLTRRGYIRLTKTEGLRVYARIAGYARVDLDDLRQAISAQDLLAEVY